MLIQKRKTCIKRATNLRDVYLNESGRYNESIIFEEERYMTQQISSKEWQEKVLGATKPVLVDFFATWCGPCKMMAPVIDEIAQERAGSVEVYKIDIDQNPDIASQYGVTSIPTFIAFQDGQPIAKTLGAQPKEQILALLS